MTRFTTLRALLAVASMRNMEILQVDIKTAFLNGFLEEEVYMEQPEGISHVPGPVCRLKKALYGLKQAPRAWNLCLDGRLKNLGFKQSRTDPSLYMTQRSSGSVYVLVYVDDLLIFAMNTIEAQKILDDLSAAFDTRSLGNATYFLGIEIERDRTNGTLKIVQKQYIKDLLRRCNISECHPNKITLPVRHGVSRLMCPSSPKESKRWTRFPIKV